MDLLQRQIVALIKSAIKGEKVHIDENQNIDWEAIINLSKEHKVEGLVYSSLSNEIKKSICEELLNPWKKDVFISGITQQNHMKEVESILHSFNHTNIDVLVLKGIVIRDLYPSPTLRTMSDADIVVREEDLAIFQCIHMAKHLVYRGFGIRHLIDFTLLVNKRGSEINWINFIDRCKKYGIYKFVLQVIAACNVLFNMEIPKDLEFVSNCDKSYLNQFINDIFNSGVHGKHDFVSSVASEFAYTADKDNKENESSLKRYMKFLFPKVENLSDTYNYAKKYKVLHPVAWGHHLVRGVCNKDYSLNEKIKFTTETVSVSQKRNNLITWLEL